jgi:hypothetical protein
MDMIFADILNNCGSTHVITTYYQCTFPLSNTGPEHCIKGREKHWPDAIQNFAPKKLVTSFVISKEKAENKAEDNRARWGKYPKRFRKDL